jgi:hypothetical protein
VNIRVNVPEGWERRDAIAQAVTQELAVGLEERFGIKPQIKLPDWRLTLGEGNIYQAWVWGNSDDLYSVSLSSADQSAERQDGVHRKDLASLLFTLFQEKAREDIANLRQFASL